MVKIWSYFHKSIWVGILFFFNLFVSKTYVFKSFRQNIIFLDFVGFPFKISKLKNDISYIKYKFSHRFEKVCRWLNMYYSKIGITIFFKLTTMFTWIILKNLVWTYEECNFFCYWATAPCIHPPLSHAMHSHHKWGIFFYRVALKFLSTFLEKKIAFAPKDPSWLIIFSPKISPLMKKNWIKIYARLFELELSMILFTIIIMEIWHQSFTTYPCIETQFLLSMLVTSFVVSATYPTKHVASLLTFNIC